MIYETKKILLKNETIAIFRSPLAADSAKMIEFLKTCAAETNYILRYPEECDETEEQEANYLDSINQSQTGIMIICIIDGEIAGNCQIMFQKRLKTRHRATVAIGIIQKYWGIGVGTAMFKEMVSIAKEKGVLQLELDYIDGNERAKQLYEKMGFIKVAERVNAIRLKDGTMLNELSMIKQL